MSTITVRTAGGEALTEELEDIFREHYRFVYRTAYSITGSSHDAEDVLQTIFLRLLQRELSIEFKPTPRAYLYRAAVNLSLNIVQSRKRHNQADDLEGVERPAMETSDDTEQDDEIQQQHLLDAIAQLRPRAVEILLLHYEHGYSDAEIAKILGKSRGTIAVTLYRTRTRLRKLMLCAVSSGGRR
jgi:RNA polymerase sigma-70 factor (ECF subfamily)